MISKRLSRQIKKSLGTEDFQGSLASLKAALAASTGVTDENREALNDWIDNFPSFLTSIDKTFLDLDDRAQMAQRNIELSSAELTESNSSLLKLNHTFSALLDSLGQAFLLFDHEGTCLSTYSRSCVEILEIEPGGRQITDVLRVRPDRVVFFNKWRDLLFFGDHEFDTLIEIAPKSFPSSDKHKTINLEFKPVHDALGKLLYVVVVATDRTAEVRAQRQAHEMHAFATLVTSVLRDRYEFQKFVTRCWSLLAGMEQDLRAETINDTQFAILKRHLHTLKGGSSSFGLIKVSDFVHEAETRLSEVGSLQDAHRVLASTVAQTRELLSSVLEAHKDLIDNGMDPQGRMREVSLNDLRAFHERLQDKSVLDPAHEFRTRFLAVPVNFVFRNFNRVVLEDAKRVGKELAPLEIVADPELRMIPEMYEEVIASFVHILRNMVDHGIEAPGQRIAVGKTREGHVRLQVERIPGASSDQLKITMSDDGGGIDVSRIRIKIGPASQGKSDTEMMEKIFEDGFSTADRVTALSGRGVGMGAVRMEVERLGGRIQISSKRGEGTTFSIYLPYFEDFTGKVDATYTARAS